ncbi:hypothetical protein EV191_105111 [Tamaricihabitans halophyticus]|uniref:Uncharacterized protein n=1 Tax=Tamaricihabitans halophyticus TaxID=1262583 RepID=A0A4R2QVE8_9PSEU|nr:gephyrin-like molybdotransferase receptor GlpR [Tamaricihabitans halophyticus]TCP53049.1 hypothetical protein EV191_105111 [Tamaricihabitans halophyticus]
MPSSLIIVGLVAAWLVVLVPMIARKRQEIAKTAEETTSSRVLRSVGVRRGRREEFAMTGSSGNATERDFEADLDDSRAGYADDEYRDRADDDAFAEEYAEPVEDVQRDDHDEYRDYDEYREDDVDYVDEYAVDERSYPASRGRECTAAVADEDYVEDHYAASDDDDRGAEDYAPEYYTDEPGEWAPEERFPEERFPEERFPDEWDTEERATEPRAEDWVDDDRATEDWATEDWGAQDEWAKAEPAAEEYAEAPRARTYRPGRGGFDPEAAALAAKAKYRFRQRVVLIMLIAAVVSAVAALITVPLVWWAHGAIDAVLIGYLVYLRRQVRLEEDVRQRRLARMERARRMAAARRAEAPEQADRAGGVEDEAVAEEPAELRRRPTPRPSAPRAPAPLPGTVVLELDDEDPAFNELDDPSAQPFRRAVGE